MFEDPCIPTNGVSFNPHSGLFDVYIIRETYKTFVGEYFTIAEAESAYIEALIEYIN